MRRFDFFQGMGALALGAASAWAAPVVFPSNTVPVTLDGQVLGSTAAGGLRNTVVQAEDGRYHLWFIPNGADSRVSQIVHATSDDGIQFSTQGTLAPPTNYWQAGSCTAPPPSGEPIASFLRVSQVDGDWIMMVWHQNQSEQDLYSTTPASGVSAAIRAT
jgi:hypothetical protein